MSPRPRHQPAPAPHALAPHRAYGNNPAHGHAVARHADRPRGPGRDHIGRVTFHSSETGFWMLPVKARGHRDRTTTIGHAATISAGEWIAASGDRVNDSIDGQQFTMCFLSVSPSGSRIIGWKAWQQPTHVGRSGEAVYFSKADIASASSRRSWVGFGRSAPRPRFAGLRHFAYGSDWSLSCGRPRRAAVSWVVCPQPTPL